MSFQAILDSVLPPRSNFTESSNATNSGNIPSQLFESIIPGYGPIHKFILYTFGLDITILVTLFAAIWAISKLGHYIFMTIYSLVAENYLSSIHVSSYDDIYEHLMKWLADQPHLLRALDELRGRDLVCFCAPRACHGDLLLRLEQKSPDQS